MGKLPFSVETAFLGESFNPYAHSSLRDCPNYILFIIVAVSVALFYIVAKWFWGMSVKEGFSNTKYTYVPDKNSANLSIQFGLNDLAVDVSSVCDFIKIDSKLVVTNKESFSTFLQETFSDESASPSPSASLPSTTSPDRSSGLSISKNTSSPTPTQQPFKSATASDYTVPYTELQIYKMYNSATGYSSTSNANTYKMMDVSYGAMFDTAQIGNMTDENIASMWNANKSIAIDDAIYNWSNYYVINSDLNNRQCEFGLSAYFLQQIQKNKKRESILTSLKHAYYAVIKTRFLANSLSNIYWNNAESFTNSDKGTFNSAIFVLNTFSSLANTNTLATDLSENEVADIISKDTPFTVDAIQLYQIMSIMFELQRFCAYFKVKGSSTSSSGNPAITTDLEKIRSGYKLYLQKVNQIAPSSPVLFLIQNLPADDKCPTVLKLSAYINNVSF